MKAEIVMIGTELLLGQIIDANAAHMGRVLAENGIPLYHKTTVGDNMQRIVQSMQHALDRADVVLTSGGLGPTEDDLTREAVATLFGRTLLRDPALVARLEQIFAMLGRPMTPNNLKQADVPQGGCVLENPHGTAPGLWLEDDRGLVICMPGVPHELHAMLNDQVIPRLRNQFAMNGVMKTRVLKVCGLGESTVDQAIGDLILASTNPTVGVLASIDVVRIRIVARANSPAEAESLIAPIEMALRERLPGKIMGADEDTLEGVVDALLTARGWRLAIAETDTGGAIAQRMAGARSFAGGIVLPAPSAANGQTARQLAMQALQAAGEPETATCALALAYDSPSTVTYGHLRTPTAHHDWQARYPGLDTLHQVRLAVGALEQLRRVLMDE